MPRKSFWARLPFGVRMATAGLGVLALVGGAAGGVAALTGRDEPAPGHGRQAAMAAPLELPDQTRTGTGSAAGRPAPAGVPPVAAGDQGEVADRPGQKQADRTATRAPRRTPVREEPVRATNGEPGGSPSVVTRTEELTETQTIPFRTELVRDPSLPRGSKRVQSQGIPGERTMRYRVTFRGGQETSRELLGSTVTREPQNRVVGYGNSRSDGDDGPGDDDGPGGPGDGGGGWGHGGAGQGSGGQSSGGWGHGGGGGHHGNGGRWNRGRGGCGPDCRPGGRKAACDDEVSPREEKALADPNLRLLTDEQFDALDLALPCDAPAKPASAAKPASSASVKNAPAGAGGAEQAPAPEENPATDRKE